jgi:hypothetical protein
MRSPSRFTKLAGFAVIIGLFVMGSLHSANLQVDFAAQATAAGTLATLAGPTPTQEPCPPSVDMAMMTATVQSTVSATAVKSPNSSAPGFLGVEVSAVDNCAVHVLQVFKGSSASGVLQVNDLIVAVDCVALSDLVGGSMVTAAAGSTTSSNCMSTNVAPAAGGKMGGVSGAMSDPACMNTGVAGGTLRITSVFFCVIGHYHAGDTVTLTLFRNNQQMNVSVVLDPAPPPATATGAATTNSVVSTTASTGPTATPAATTAATTAATPAATATSAATGTTAPTP